jgi:hypothetical protein
MRGTIYSAFDWAIFLTCGSLQLVTLAILFRRKLYRQLFFFTTYLAVCLVTDIEWRWVSLTPAFYSRLWFYIYWAIEFLLSILRLLAFAEISKRILRGYPTIFTTSAWLLTAATTILLAWTANPAIHYAQRRSIRIIIGDQRFALMQAVLILAILTIGAYYRILIPPLYRLILVGIAVYASVQVANDQMIIHQTAPVTQSIFDYVRRASIVLSIMIWTYAVSRWSALPELEPKLISRAAYDDLSPQVHNKMQELNDKLAKLV